MKINLDSLKRLCTIHAVSGDTYQMTEYLKERLSAIGIECTYNGFGVLLCGNLKNPKILLSAHCDEVGFQVVKKNVDGTWLVKKCGHVDPVQLANSVVYVETGKERIPGTFYVRKELGENIPQNFNEIFLDTLKNNQIEPGNFGSYVRSFFADDTNVLATGLDNKIGVEILLELLEENPKISETTLFAFVTEEETTYDCIAGVAAEYKPEYGLVVDMFPNHQVSGNKIEELPQNGRGPGVLWSMNSYHLNPLLRSILEKSPLEYQKVVADINFPPEPQILQRNGVTKGMNIFVPMKGWHGSVYSMLISDAVKTKELTKNIHALLNK